MFLCIISATSQPAFTDELLMHGWYHPYLYCCLCKSVQNLWHYFGVLNKTYLYDLIMDVIAGIVAILQEQSYSRGSVEGDGLQQSN